jgi:glycine C-acetyltransferase
LHRNTELFRAEMTGAGFDILPGSHPITPVMIGDAAAADRMAQALLALGIYVIAFSYPVVPKDKARIRVQLSAAHSDDDVRTAVAAFVKVRDELAR